MTPPVLAECREKAPEAKNSLVVRVAAVVVLAVLDLPRGVGSMARGAGVLTPLGEAGCMCYDLTAG